MILALESSTHWMSMGLFEEERVLFEVSHYTLSGHSRFLFQYLETIAREFDLSARLEALVVGLGPGFFTGVKIASMVGKSLAYSLKKPIVGFSTLEIMANGVEKGQADLAPDQVLVPVIFHKRDEVFWSSFPPDFSQHPAPVNICIGSPQEVVKSLKGQAALVITPWTELYRYFQREGLTCYHPFFSFPKAGSLARLYFVRKASLQPDWKNLFSLVPMYGTEPFIG